MVLYLSGHGKDSKDAACQHFKKIKETDVDKNNKTW